MKPVRGEKLPLQSISRSQSWRGMRSHEGQSRDWALISLARLAETVRSTNLPPCGALRWLVTGILSIEDEVGFARTKRPAAPAMPGAQRKLSRSRRQTPGRAGGYRD